MRIRKMNLRLKTQIISTAVIAVAAVILLIVQPWDSGSVRILWDGERPGYWYDGHSLTDLVYNPELHCLQVIPHRVTITKIEVSTLDLMYSVDIHEYAAQDNTLFSIESSDPLTLTFFENASGMASVNFYYNNRWNQQKIYGLEFNQSSQDGTLHIFEYRRSGTPHRTGAPPVGALPIPAIRNNESYAVTVTGTVRY